MAIKCPACANRLTEIAMEDLMVDVCKGGCGGIWFDMFEFKKVDEQHEHKGEALLDIERDPQVQVDLVKKRDCPKCQGIPMMRRYSCVKRRVEIDECPSCGGIWLDAGELRDIRQSFKNAEERNKAFDEYFNDVFEERLRQRKEMMDDEIEKTRDLAKAFRYICPSYWISGKQDWGAF